MQATQAPTIRTPKIHRGYRFALIGLICGFIGLGVAAYRMSVESQDPTPPRAKEISDVLSDTIKKTADKLRGQAEPPPTTEWPKTKKLGLAATILGFIGAAFGCVSWLAHEQRRWTWAALCVGICAMAWTHVVVAVALAAGIAILIIIISYM